ncbi:hypothetical protein GHK52_08885 [Lactococcus garvieae]|nr:hypothetical protein [Lactococcus garvieae]
MYKFMIISSLVVLAVFCGVEGAKARETSRGQSYSSVTSSEADGNFEPINNHDGTVTFMNQTWSVIKDMGEGNVMIGSTQAIAFSHFSLEHHHYYPSSSLSWLNDGYRDSLVKKEVDAWYQEKIKGTDYEKAVVPVYLHNPIFMDMKKLGWKSYNDGNISTHSWRVHVIGPETYPTVVNHSYGHKQAFILSGSDLAEKKQGWPADYYTGKLILNAIHYRDRLYNNGVSISWLRSPSEDSYGASGLYAREARIRGFIVWFAHGVVPALVVHIK